MKVLDLFSGIGGFSLGLERAGMETVAFCENDAKCRQVLTKHWPSVPQFEDVKTLSKEVLDETGITDIGLICGGFPCQDISAAGRQAGISTETRSGLWSECARLLGEIRPQYAIFENVTNLLAGQRGAWFRRVLWDISQVGFDVEWHCLPASQFGYDHHRDRVWIVAYAKREGRQRLIANTTILRCAKKENSVVNNTASAKQLALDIGSQCLRSDDGISAKPHRDRIHQLGNAVVPQIPEIIGKAIMEIAA